MQRGKSNARFTFHKNFLAIAAAVLAAVSSTGLAATTTNSALVVSASSASTSSAGAAGTTVKTPQQDNDLGSIVGRLLAQPNKENFTALQNRVVADRGYDPTSRGLTEMTELYNGKRYQAALDRFMAAMPDQILSAHGHFYAARCREELGQKDLQKMEMAFVRACIEGLMSTGDGSPEHPILVTHASDEYDLLAGPLHSDSKSQKLLQKQGRWYDVLECADGKTYWFDVTLTLGHASASGSASASGNAAVLPIPPSVPSSQSFPVSKAPSIAARILTGGAAAFPPAPPIETRASQAMAAYNRGVAAITRRDYARAIAELDEAVRLDPISPDAFFERGFAFIESQKYGSAYVDFTDAIRLRSDYALAFYERGLALRLEGDKAQFDGAIADFSEAIRLAPGDYLAWRNRAMVWFAKGDYQKSIADNSEAIMLRPGDATSYSNRGFAYESAQDFSKAIADFNQAIRLSPRFAQAYAGRGFAWIGRGEYDLAIADLDEAIRLKPDYAAAYAYRATAFTQKGDTKRAQADATRATTQRSIDAAAAGQ